MNPLVTFDLETTSADKNTCRIVSITLQKEGKDSLTTLVNPEMPIPKEASDIHGITDAMVKDQRVFKQIAPGILKYITGCDLLSYNGNQFDIPILYREFSRAGIKWDYKQHNFIDAATIFKRNEERTLSAAYLFYCGKTLEDAHTSDADTKATREVFDSQLSRYDLPRNRKELALYSNYDRELIDIAGVFSKDADGDYVFNLGKHKGHKIQTELNYLKWMLGADFLPDVKEIIESVINLKK